MSVLDGLTGLYNRRQFELSLEQEHNRSKRHPSDFSLAILDIDFFKKVNDTYGHQYGDYVLKTVEDLMKSAFRKTDLLFHQRFYTSRFSSYLHTNNDTMDSDQKDGQQDS